MTFDEMQESIYTLTDKQVKAIAVQMADDYATAMRSIDAKLKKLYLEILSGVHPDRYYAVAVKYNRLKKLLVSVQSDYIKAARASGQKTIAASELALSNVYYRTQYALSWGEDAFSVFVPINQKIVEASVYGIPQAWDKLEKTYGSQLDYLPKSGTLIEELIDKRNPATLSALQSDIRQGLIQGRGYRNTARDVRKTLETDLNKALTIVRTESHRVSSVGNLAMTSAAREEGLDVRRTIVSTLDNRTRPQSVRVDDKQENDEGYFVYPEGELVRVPGNSGKAGWDINDREVVVNRIPGMEPTTRRARDPVTGKSDIISWQSFETWAKSNGLKKNKYGQLLV